jgi:hypothetical protein
MSKPANGNGVKKEEPGTKGLKFGTGVAYDDYGGTGGDEEYVDALPTPDEERKMRGEDVRAREAVEELDEGRVSSHPSTLSSSSKAKVSDPMILSIATMYEVRFACWKERIKTMLLACLL